MFPYKPIFLITLLFFVSELPAQETGLKASGQAVWELQHEEKGASFRGLSAVSPEVCWVSGTGGRVLRTRDGGETWDAVGPPACEELDFRDIEAWDENTAVVMSSGELDRIYRTTDGGQTWELVFEHPQRAAFFDGMVFANRDLGWLMGDPLAGRMMILQTTDGGRSWAELSAEQLPIVEEGEAGFAASGTNLAAGPRVGSLAIALGGAPAGKHFESSRILFTNDGGRSWEAWSVPIVRGEASGMFSLCCVDDRRWVTVGGDYRKADSTAQTAAWSENSGRTWFAVSQQPPSGYRSAVAKTLSAKGEVSLIAVGPNGTDESTDLGKSWRRVSEEGFHTIDFNPDQKAGWAAGAGGRIARWRRD
ncbi:MAG: WD40/YVTN/BNR-like repeat-containing protein [Planctomycetota bacterium]|jgi:photosystem II stability/assembly factor-like uncharacterized protein|nr:hypothetical protein [Blastopirellula sp.]